jgi:hypothetical protein
LHSISKISYYLKPVIISCLIAAGYVPQLLAQSYFQQKVRYKIQVSLNDRKHELSAYESVEYINNSPDSLTFLYFHLWPNAYSSNKTDLARQLIQDKGRQKLFDDPALAGSIDSLDFRINGTKTDWNLLPDHPDICIIRLNKALSPGDTIIITTPFHVKIPLGITSRLGHIGESYQISQWYPKPAVYDREGWHQMSYLDQGEFYSEYGSFDVKITLPANYIVGASGELANPEEKKWLLNIATDTIWKIAAGYLRDPFPRSSLKLKTLHYTGENIHDFAWFADKRFHVMKGVVKLPDSGRSIDTWVLCTNQQAELWINALKFTDRAVLYFSRLIGDYPYESLTVVQSALTAGSGMEYPGITIIGKTDNAYTLDDVIAHEICHNWFYSALGSNERRYPFMDESITTSYEERYMKDSYPGKKLWEIYFRKPAIARILHIDKMPVQRIGEMEWLAPARTGIDQNINLPAPAYTVDNYYNDIYTKAAVGFNYLRAYLGDRLYDSVIHKYYYTWMAKHPQPEDLKRIFETETGKNLSWFFDDFIGTTRRLDYKIVRYANRKLLVRNRGELISPVVIAGMKGDSVLFRKWDDGFSGSKWFDIQDNNFTSLQIDPAHEMPELYRLNNNTRRTGIFRKADPFRLQFLYTIDDPDKRTVIFFPAINFTKEDGFMVGFNIHNSIVLPKPVEFSLTPFYKVHDPDIAGDGKISFNITPYDNAIRKATFSLEGTQYGSPGIQNYLRAKAGVDIWLSNDNMTNSLQQKISGNFIAASDLYQIELTSELKTRYFAQLGYLVERKSIVNPYSLRAEYETGRSYGKSSVEFNYRISYYGLDNGLDFRLYSGVMLKNNPLVPFYSFSSGGRDGLEQYLFEGTFYDRFNESGKSLWSRQMTLSEGSLVSPVNDSLGFSKWIVSLTVTSNLPGFSGRLPVKAFLNILLNDHSLGNGSGSPLFYEAGFKAGIWKFMEIYVPLVVSGNISSLNPTIKDRIRFIMNLDEITNIKLKW